MDRLGLRAPHTRSNAGSIPVPATLDHLSPSPPGGNVRARRALWGQPMLAVSLYWRLWLASVVGVVLVLAVVVAVHQKQP